MRGILIDPKAREVTEVDVPYDTEGYKVIYRFIDADCFDVVNLNEARDALYVDDEGLSREDQSFFVWKSYHQPLAGKSLILGTNDEGETVATSMSLNEARESVTFPSVKLEVKGWEEINERIDHPVFGPDTPLIGHRPVFGLKKEDGTEGQDRESYSDDQDRDNYTVDK